MIEIVLQKTASTDIIPLCVGEHITPSSHRFGPHIRDFTLIHFCLSGKGTLSNDRGDHPVSAGELFIIREGELTTYTADERDPWHYVWVGFVGGLARSFDSAPDVIKTPNGLGEKLREAILCGTASPEIYISMIYELMHHLFSGSREPQDKLAEIRRYIKYEYMKDLTAGGLAKRFGFDRSHLYRIFKARFGVGIKEYLTEVRMSHARDLLLGGHRVADTAYMVGYHDEFNFSKAFSAHFGYPPSKAAKQEKKPNA